MIYISKKTDKVHALSNLNEPIDKKMIQLT